MKKCPYCKGEVARRLTDVTIESISFTPRGLRPAGIINASHLECRGCGATFETEEEIENPDSEYLE